MMSLAFMTQACSSSVTVFDDTQKLALQILSATTYRATFPQSEMNQNGFSAIPHPSYQDKGTVNGAIESHSAKAISGGSLKLAQNMLFLGLTFLTK